MTSALGNKKDFREEKREIYNPALKIGVGIAIRNTETFWLR